MASLAFLLGMIPSTEKVESADDQLRADYKAFQEFENSDELKHFLGVVNGANQLISSSDEALLRMKLVENIYNSAKNKSESNL